MGNQISEKDINQKEYLNLLGSCNLKFLKDYNISQILFNETFYCQCIDKRDVIKKALSSILCRPSLIECDIKNRDILTLYTKGDRTDYDFYWRLMLKDVGNHDEITILSKCGRLKRLDFLFLAKRIIWLLAFWRDLNIIKNRTHRLYLSSRLVARKWVLEKVKKMHLSPKIVMCFFDSSPDESLIMQYFKKEGAITVTNQHGQQPFRSFEYDRVNQSQILNVKCDYYLARGEFQKRQFELANKYTVQVVKIGDINGKRLDIKIQKSSVFGVYLDTPGFEFSEESNPQLIEIANRISAVCGYNYFIKIHPTDYKDKYFYAKNYPHCIDIIGKEIMINDSFSMCDFAIAHASSSYIDAYVYGIRCFKFNTEINFPIANSNDLFSDEEEFVRKYHLWSEMSLEQRTEYINGIRREYDSGWKDGNIGNLLRKILSSHE